MGRKHRLLPERMGLGLRKIKRLASCQGKRHTELENPRVTDSSAARTQSRAQRH